MSGTASYTPSESNIAGKLWVSASSSQGDARMALDGNPDTAWMATSAPAALTVDLGGAYDAVHKADGDTSSPAYQEFLGSVQNLARLIDAGNRAVHDVNAEEGTHIDTQLHFAFNEFEQPSGTAPTRRSSRCSTRSTRCSRV